MNENKEPNEALEPIRMPVTESAFSPLRGGTFRAKQPHGSASTLVSSNNSEPRFPVINRTPILRFIPNHIRTPILRENQTLILRDIPNQNQSRFSGDNTEPRRREISHENQTNSGNGELKQEGLTMR